MSPTCRFKSCYPHHAEVAELADAHGSGPCESNLMRVQVPLSAGLKIAVNPIILGVTAIFFISAEKYCFADIARKWQRIISSKWDFLYDKNTREKFFNI